MACPYFSLTVHGSEFPARRQAALHEALRARRLPGKLLYQSPAQAQRWLIYHEAWSPSRAAAAVRALYTEVFAAAAAEVGNGAAHLIGVGCGGGGKDTELLSVLRARAAQAESCAARERAPPPLRYTPLDASPSLVMEAGLRAAALHPPPALRPLVADLAAAPALEPWLAEGEGDARRVVTCFGMLPNQDAEVFPRWLRGLLRPGEPLLASANLSPAGFAEDAARILAQYDNPPARAWYEGCLAELGFPREALALSVTAAPLAGDGSAWRVEVSAEVRAPCTLALPGASHAFSPGERLAVFFSNRFTAAAAEQVLAAGGLAVRRRWIASGGEEGIFLCGAA
jgi:uncharacterized SAM-dependent methyltransferase